MLNHYVKVARLSTIDYQEECLHKCRDGTQIPISKMEDSHLINTIILFRKYAVRGLTIVTGSADSYGIDGDADFLWGNSARTFLNLKAYESEARKRGLLS